MPSLAFSASADAERIPIIPTMPEDIERELEQQQGLSTRSFSLLVSWVRASRMALEAELAAQKDVMDVRLGGIDGKLSEIVKLLAAQNGRVGTAERAIRNLEERDAVSDGRAAAVQERKRAEAAEQERREDKRWRLWQLAGAVLCSSSVGALVGYLGHLAGAW